MALLPTSVTAGQTGHLAHHDQIHAKLDEVFDVRVDYGATGDGSTDDTAAVQAALDAANANGGGIVFFPVGTYLCTDMSIGAHTTLQGTGDGSIIKQKFSATDGQYLLSVNPNDAGTADPTTNIVGVTVRDLQLRGTVDTDAFLEHVYLLNLSAASDVLVDHVTFRGFRGDGIYLGSGNINPVERHNERITVRHCLFDGINNDNRNGISIIDGTDVLISGCVFENICRSNMPGAIDLEPNVASTFARVRAIQIIGNRFRGIGGNVGVVAMDLTLAQASMTTPMHGLVIEGNTIEDCPNANSAFFLLQAGTPTATSARNDIVIANNHVYNGVEPFELDGVRGITFVGNSFHNMGSAGVMGWAAGTWDVSILNNTFSSTGTGGGTCLNFYNNVNRTVIQGNTFDNIGLANGTDGRVLNLTTGSGSTGSSDYIWFTGNRIVGTTATAAAAKNASHTVTNTAHNVSKSNILNGLTVLASVFTGTYSDP